MVFFVSVTQYFLCYFVGFLGASVVGTFEIGLTLQGRETERERYSSSEVVRVAKMDEAFAFFVSERS